MPKLSIKTHSVEDHYPRNQSYGFVVSDPAVHFGPNKGGNIVPHRVYTTSICLPELVVPTNLHNLNRPFGSTAHRVFRQLNRILYRYPKASCESEWVLLSFWPSANSDHFAGVINN
eukprot:2001886-Pyramimonas_sp.AAC.1